MIKFTDMAFLVATLAVPCSAQDCSHLSTSGSGHRGTMMSFTLTNGHPNAPAMMGVAMVQGHTYFHFGAMGSLHLGLGSPLYLMPMGMTNVHGAVMMQLPVPMGMMHRMSIHGQGFTFMFHHGGGHGGSHHHGHFSFCTSNVHRFGVGGHR